MATSEKQVFIQSWEREFPTTLKVLKAFPAGKGSFKPHDRSATVAEISRAFPMAQIFVEQVLKGEFQVPPKLPELPHRRSAVVGRCVTSHPHSQSELALPQARPVPPTDALDRAEK